MAVDDKVGDSPERPPVHALWHDPSLGGLRLIRENIPHDGNCFFTSIVGALQYLQISNPPEDQQAVRNAVASWAAKSTDIALYLESRTLEQYQASVKSNLSGGDNESVKEIFKTLKQPFETDSYGEEKLSHDVGHAVVLATNEAEYMAMQNGNN